MCRGFGTGPGRGTAASPRLVDADPEVRPAIASLPDRIGAETRARIEKSDVAVRECRRLEAALHARGRAAETMSSLRRRTDSPTDPQPSLRVAGPREAEAGRVATGRSRRPPWTGRAGPLTRSSEFETAA